MVVGCVIKCFECEIIILFFYTWKLIAENHFAILLMWANYFFISLRLSPYLSPFLLFQMVVKMHLFRFQMNGTTFCLCNRDVCLKIFQQFHISIVKLAPDFAHTHNIDIYFISNVVWMIHCSKCLLRIWYYQTTYSGSLQLAFILGEIEHLQMVK